MWFMCELGRKWKWIKVVIFEKHGFLDLFTLLAQKQLYRNQKESNLRIKLHFEVQTGEKIPQQYDHAYQIRTVIKSGNHNSCH